MKPSLHFSIASAAIVILSLQVAQVDAAPTHHQSFEQWCLQKDSLPVETKKTIEALLNNARSQDCKLADMKLNSLSKLYLWSLEKIEAKNG
jgi:internalin A